MPVSDERARKLLGVLAQENSKTGQHRVAPSKFRDTSLDTHKTTPSEYFGPSPDLLPPGHTAPPDYLTIMRTQRATHRANAATRRPIDSRRGDIPAEEIVYTSVFKPREDQRHVCDLAKRRRENLKNSEWAHLDMLEVELYNNEKQWKHTVKKMTESQCRAHLDAQIEERRKIEEQEKYMAQREADMLMEELRQGREEAKRQAKIQHEKNQTIAKQRFQMLDEVRANKRKEQLARQAEEAKVLADIVQRQELDRQIVAEKLEKRKEAAAKTRADNEARIQARKDAIALKNQMDEELMREGIRLADKQAADREAAAVAFKEMIEKRVRGAGQQALEDKKALVEREARLMREYEERAEANQLAKEKASKEKRMRHQQELTQSRNDFLAAKAAKEAAARMEMLAVREQADKAYRDAQADHEMKMKGIRLRAQAVKDQQMQQVAELEDRACEDFVAMNIPERQINHRLVTQATRMVGTETKQMAVDWQ